MLPWCRVPSQETPGTPEKPEVFSPVNRAALWARQLALWPGNFLSLAENLVLWKLVFLSLTEFPSSPSLWTRIFWVKAYKTLMPHAGFAHISVWKLCSASICWPTTTDQLRTRHWGYGFCFGRKKMPSFLYKHDAFMNQVRKTKKNAY